MIFCPVPENPMFTLRDALHAQSLRFANKEVFKKERCFVLFCFFPENLIPDWGQTFEMLLKEEMIASTKLLETWK